MIEHILFSYAQVNSYLYNSPPNMIEFSSAGDMSVKRRNEKPLVTWWPAVDTQHQGLHSHTFVHVNGKNLEGTPLCTNRVTHKKSKFSKNLLISCYQRFGGIKTCVTLIWPFLVVIQLNHNLSVDMQLDHRHVLFMMNIWTLMCV